MKKLIILAVVVLMSVGCAGVQRAKITIEPPTKHEPVRLEIDLFG